MNKNEAVDMLKVILGTVDIFCPNLFSLDAINDSTNYKVIIKARDRDKPALKEIVLSYGLTVYEDKDSMVIS